MSFKSNKSLVLNKEVAALLKKSEASFNNAKKSFKEKVKKQTAACKKVDLENTERLEKYLADLEKKKETIKRNKNSLDKKLNKIKASTEEASINESYDKAILDAQNKYNKLRSEYVGKITILEKDALIAAKDLLDNHVETDKNIKVKYNEQEKRAIHEINAIEEQILFPVGSPYTLNIDNYLNGNKQTRTYDPDKARVIREKGIKEIEEKTLYILNEKRDFEINQFSGNVLYKKDNEVLKHETDIKTYELRKLLEENDAEFATSEANALYNKNASLLSDKERIEAESHNAIISNIEKTNEIMEKINQGYPSFLKDRLAILEELYKADLHIVDAVKFLLDKAYFDISLMIEELTHNKYKVAILKTLATGLNDIHRDIVNICKDDFTKITSFNYATKSYEYVKYDDLKDSVEKSIEKFVGKVEPILDKASNNVQELKSKGEVNFGKVVKLLSNLQNKIITFEDKMFSSIKLAINSNYNSNVAFANTEANKYYELQNDLVLTHNDEYNHLINEEDIRFNKLKSENVVTAASLRKKIDEECLVIEKSKGLKIQALDYKINDLNKEIAKLNSEAIESINAYTLKVNTKTNKLINSAKRDALNKFKRI